MNAKDDTLHEIRYLEAPTIPEGMTVDEYRRVQASKRRAARPRVLSRVRQVAAVAALR